ncbi:universal stress protein [Pseudonocardia sp. Cha107L01]|uniref:universal stress protein n=1 Tax=Pseudonocardia sp. Cha107L01 TaxID=3457576 RepID=UPI00403E4B42
MVGVDAGGAAAEAVVWAAAEAAAQHCPLRIVHAFHQPAVVDPHGVLLSLEGISCLARESAERTLQRAQARVRSIAPDIEVLPLLLWGAAARVLPREAADAQLLVLGNRGLCGVRRLLAGSVSIQVSARARCPVVVVHPFDDGVSLGCSPPRVVVGVDATPSCAPAIGFAFQAARQRGVGLTAVHAWSPDTPADVEAVRGDPMLAEYLGMCSVEHTLACWRDLYSEVPVVIKVVQTDPAGALIAESAGAALVVVASAGRARLLGTPRASVGRTVLRHAHSPIAIVGHHYTPIDAAPPRPAATAQIRHRPLRRRKRT